LPTGTKQAPSISPPASRQQIGRVPKEITNSSHPTGIFFAFSLNQGGATKGGDNQDRFQGIMMRDPSEALEAFRAYASLDHRTLLLLHHQELDWKRENSNFNEQQHSGRVENVIISVDVKAYELDQSHVLEIGLTQFCGPDCRPQIVCRHLIIEENLHLNNGQYVADNREEFLFGVSEDVTMSDAADIVSQALRGAQGEEDKIVGHAMRGDISWLQSLGVDSALLNPARLYETQTHAIAASPDSRPRSLESLARDHGLAPEYLHNGGNDAYYTLAVMLRQTGVHFQPLVPGERTEDAFSLKKISTMAAARLGRTECLMCQQRVVRPTVTLS
jgi:hypothetical protein